MLEAWLDLENLYPGKITHEVLGKTWQNKDILLFKIGNQLGGRVWFNGTIHGGEIVGPEVYYKYARWLLDNMESGISDRIMSRNYTLIVPFTNADGYPTIAPVEYVTEGRRTNRNPSGGVNLNRNAPRTWRNDCGVYDPALTHWKGDAPDTTTGACTVNPSYPTKMPPLNSGRNNLLGYCYKSGCGSAWNDIPSDWEYRGSNPGSEPETQAILNGLANWKPKFFLDYHIWAGPIIYKTMVAGTDAPYHDSVITKSNVLATQRGVSGYNYGTGGVNGMLLDSAYATIKATSYLIEALGVTHKPGDPTNYYDMLGPYTDITTNAFPRFLPLAITFSQESEIVTPLNIVPIIIIAAGIVLGIYLLR